MPKVGEKMSDEQKAKIRAALLVKGKSPTKRCPKCGETKDRGEFGVRRANGHSRSNCRSCELAAWRTWKERNPDKVRRYNRRASLRRWFGISEEQYDALLSEQDGVCAICGGLEPTRNGFLYVDHCHTTGRIRGLLCSSCNSGIGLLRDDPMLIRAAAFYLEQTIPENALRAKPGLPSGLR